MVELVPLAIFTMYLEIVLSNHGSCVLRRGGVKRESETDGGGWDRRELSASGEDDQLVDCCRAAPFSSQF